jgi:hypothetical protein
VNKPLANAKHEHFAQLVSNGENPTRAYVLAGYSENGAKQSANRLLTNADLCARIAHLRSIKEQKHAAAVTTVIAKAGLSKEWVIEQLMENVSMAKQAEPVRDNEGNPTGEYRQNLNAANKALELLGVEMGMFVKQAVIRTGPLENLPPDEAKAVVDAIDAINRVREASRGPVGAAGHVGPATAGAAGAGTAGG